MRHIQITLANAAGILDRIDIYGATQDYLDAQIAEALARLARTGLRAGDTIRILED